jgi:hypothetical protein
LISVDWYSLVSLPMEVYSGEHYLTNATGFFVRYEHGLYLISNWHVFSGRNANTGQPLDIRMLIPDRLNIALHGKVIGTTAGIASLKIRSDEDNFWLQHSAGQEHDIACMKIESTPPNSTVYVAFDEVEPSKRKLLKEMGGECFVIGHPIKAILTEMLPIWKRATIATEFQVTFRGKKCFLVDTTTSDGMSGSPVFLGKSGNVRFEGENSTALASPPVTEFIGVYSGRITKAPEGILDLGIVWKKELIDEMVAAPCVGSYEIKGM